MNLVRLEVYNIGEEITKTTINKMHIADQFFHPIKEEPLGDISRVDYRVGSFADQNVNPKTEIAQLMKQKKQTKHLSESKVPQTKQPHKERIKRPSSSFKRKHPSKPPTQTQPQIQTQT